MNPIIQMRVLAGKGRPCTRRDEPGVFSAPRVRRASTLHRASDTETLQSQVNKAAKKRLSLSGLEVLHGRPSIAARTRDRSALASREYYDSMRDEPDRLQR